MAAKKMPAKKMAAKKAASNKTNRDGGGQGRPSKVIKEYQPSEMANRSARTMTQNELQQALVKKYGYPNFGPGSFKEYRQQFKDVVSESNLWNYPGVMKAANKVADMGHQMAAEKDMKNRSRANSAKKGPKKK